MIWFTASNILCFYFAVLKKQFIFERSLFFFIHLGYFFSNCHVKYLVSFGMKLLFLTQWCRNLGAQLTLFQPWGADYAHHITDCPPGFENLAASLSLSKKVLYWRADKSARNEWIKQKWQSAKLKICKR
jgi:hypothetical protein